MKAEIFSYARSRGIFAGIAVDGGRLAPYQKAISSFYGTRIYPERILFDHEVPEVPQPAKDFLAVLP